MFIFSVFLTQDYDGDHRVSYKDFQEAIRSENLLLQGFGQCLPDEKVGSLWHIFIEYY